MRTTQATMVVYQLLFLNITKNADTWQNEVPVKQSSLIFLAYYMGYRHVSYKNCRGFRTQLLVLFEESKFCHITPLLRSLHWLPVKHRIDFKVLLPTFKAIYGLTLPYISELISVKDTSGRYSLRSNNGILLNLPTYKSFTTLGDRSLYMAAPQITE